MKSLNAALTLLSHFMGSATDLGVGELAERTGMPKSKVSKILATFRSYGLLMQDTARRYRVDARAFALGSRFVNQSPLAQAALPVMRSLCERSGHSVRLSIRVGDDVLYLIGIEGPHFIETGWRAGAWLPLHATSAARIFLATMEEKEVDRLLDAHGMPAITPDTVQDRGKLKAMLGNTRKHGFARNRDETARGLSTVSVPVYGNRGSLIAALTLAFPSHVIGPGDEPPLIEKLHESARALSQKMGGEVYPHGNYRTPRWTP